MEEAIRYSALAVVAALLSLLLKKNEPAIASILGWTGAVGIGLAAVAAIGVVAAYLRETEQLLQTGQGTVQLLIRIAGITVVTQGAAQMCRDAGQGTLAGQVELLGNILSMVQTIPLLQTLLTVLQSFF